jgi:hypothetical protein
MATASAWTFWVQILAHRHAIIDRHDNGAGLGLARYCGTSPV